MQNVWHIRSFGLGFIHVHYLNCTDKVHTTVGRHCCLWCEIASDQLKVPLATRGYSRSRTLQSLEHDFHEFSLGGSNIKNAKSHNNVIHEYMWEIPIDQVDHENTYSIYTVSNKICIGMPTSAPHQLRGILSYLHSFGASYTRT